MNKKNMFNVECNCNENIPCCSGYVLGEGSIIFKPSQLERIEEQYNIVSYSQAHIKPNQQAVIKEIAQKVVAVNSLNQNPTVATPPIIPTPIILPQNQESKNNQQAPLKKFTKEELDNIIVGLRTPKPVSTNNIPVSQINAPVRQTNRNIFHLFFQNLLKLFK